MKLFKKKTDKETEYFTRDYVLKLREEYREMRDKAKRYESIVEAQQNQMGEWVSSPEYYCSICRTCCNDNGFRYCPHCGSEMANFATKVYEFKMYHDE